MSATFFKCGHLNFEACLELAARNNRQEDTPTSRYGGVPYLSLLYTVSRTLGWATRGGPSGDEAGNIVYAIPDVPASAAENHQGVLVGRDANGARG